jgi:hypothetical protein
MNLSLADGARRVNEDGACAGMTNEQLAAFISTEKKIIELAIDRDVRFSLLAYQATRNQVPVQPVPASIRLTTETLRWKGQCTSIRNHAKIAGVIRKWRKKIDQLIIWDYVVDFSNYNRPLPELNTLADDLRYYQEMGVQGVFLQGDSRKIRGGWQESRYWVAAQLM